MQMHDPESRLSRMKELIRVRRDTSDLRSGELRWLESPPGTLAFSRGDVAHIANLTDDAVTIGFEESWDLVHSVGGRVTRVDGEFTLFPRCGAILKRSMAN